MSRVWLLEYPSVLALCSSFPFGSLAQFGLRHMPPNRGILVTIPLVLGWALAPLFPGLHDWDAHATIIFLPAGLACPALVTLLT